MKSNFDFNNQFVPQSWVEIDDIGQFALEAYNDENLFYYIIIQTYLGQAQIATCGPVIPDMNTLTKYGYNINISFMDFVDSKIEKLINSWLNDKYKKLTGAQVIPIEKALTNFRDVIPYIENFKEDVI